MRVLEADPSVLYKMGKNRKHRIRKAKENEAEESSEDGTGCPHVTKAINLAAMKKVIQKPTVTLGECAGCLKDGPKTPARDLFGGLVEGVAAAEGDDAEPTETTICICLQCGSQGCDRNSPHKHALKHYKTPHSSLHCIVVNLTTWSTWCYICDEEVSQNQRIQGCISALQKQSGISKPEPIPLPGRPVESQVAEASPGFVNTSVSKNASPSSCIKVKGLSNLGNTCFFNAVMQSLCQTRGLEALLIDRSKHGRVCTIAGVESTIETDSSSSEDEREEVELKNIKLSSIQTVYGDPGPVTLALLNFVQEMRGGTTRNGTVNPIALFTQICKKAPRFKGFQQQDSHELLRYLIDCIRTEEIKRGQAAILKFFKLPESVSPKKVDEETKFKVKEYGRQVKHTFIDGVFGGHLVSTVRCEECKTVSQIFEAFLDLSLPVMEEKPQRPNLILIGKKKDFVSLSETTEDGEVLAVASAMGLEVTTEKPSKHLEKKNKRIAKKDAKRKVKLHKSRSTDHHDPTSKGDQEESAGHDQDAASEDSNKNDNENDNSSSLDKDKGDDSSRQIHEVLDVKFLPFQAQTIEQPLSGVDSGRTSRAADSSPEGSKEDPGANGDEEKDDPSDADVEDNVESDISRLDTSMNASSAARFNIDTQANPVTINGTETHEPSTHVSLEGGLSVTITTEISNIEYPDTSQGLHKDDNAHIVHDSNIEISATNSFYETLVNGLPKPIETDRNFSGIIKEEVAVFNNESSVVMLCNGIEELAVSGKNDAEKPTLYCEVSVNNAPVDQLSDSLRAVTLTGDCRSEDAKGAVDKSCPDEVPPQINVTFSVNLGGTAADGSSTEETRSNGNPSHAQHKTVVESDRGEVGELVVLRDEIQQERHNILKTQQEFLKEARNYSMSTLSPRYHPTPKECSILSCLNQFTAAELLTGTNRFGCRECTKRRRKNSHSVKADKKAKDTVYSNANKQYLIFRPPTVLTLHLKRFEQTGLTSRKVNRHVDFPLLLDLAPYCSSLCQGVKEGQTKVLYSLYAVVEHSGRLSGGHYTAYIKVRPGLGPHTQFMYSLPCGLGDLLNIYMTRVLKSKDAGLGDHDSTSGKPEGGDTIDKDVEARAEALLPPGRWFHISDSRVNEVSESEVLKAQAYLLFYERIF